MGSGTGGISAWEASLRLIGDGVFGEKLPKLCLSQNLPFAPMAEAWNAGRREILPSDMGGGPDAVSQVYADVLTNRRPPYSVDGGVFDAMSACGGTFSEMTNSEARSAEKLWLQCENVLLDPAASVALASLVKSAEEGTVAEDECVFLNMTGAGRDRVREDHDMVCVGPKAVIGETCMDVRADERFVGSVPGLISGARSIIESKIRRCPEFGASLSPMGSDGSDHELIARMCRAAEAAGVGPMAAAVGVVA